MLHPVKMRRGTRFLDARPARPGSWPLRPLPHPPAFAQPRPAARPAGLLRPPRLRAAAGQGAGGVSDVRSGADTSQPNPLTKALYKLLICSIVDDRVYPGI